MHTFYNLFTYGERNLVDAAAGGCLMNKQVDEAFELIEEMATNHYQWNAGRCNTSNLQKKAQDTYSIDTIDFITSKIESLTKKFE